MDDDADRQILVLYASETGTAEDVAFAIGRHLRRWYWRTRIVSMEDFTLVGRSFVTLAIGLVDSHSVWLLCLLG